MKNDANTCRAYLGKMCDEQTDVTYLSNLGNLIVAAIEGLPKFFRQSICTLQSAYNSDLIMYPNAKRKHLYFSTNMQSMQHVTNFAFESTVVGRLKFPEM